MIYIVKDLKDYFLYDIGQFELHFSNFSINDIILECYKTYEYKMKQKQLKFIIEAEGNIPD